MKNKYMKRSKISEAKFRKIIMYFSLELDSQKIAVLTSLNRNTVNRYLGRIRSRIVDLSESQARMRHNGMTATPQPRDGHHAAHPPAPVDEGLPVFGIRARNDHIYTHLFSTGVHRNVRRLIRNRFGSRPLAVPQEWLSYDGIVDLNTRGHYRLNPVAPRTNTAAAIDNDLEAFLGFARKRWTNLHLTGNDHFNSRLKECEYRYNNRNENLYQLLLKRFREKPLS